MEKEKVKEIKEWFTKEELVKLLDDVIKQNTKLVKWLYDEHREILREFEKAMGFKGQIHFLGGANGNLENRRRKRK